MKFVISLAAVSFLAVAALGHGTAQDAISGPEFSGLPDCAKDCYLDKFPESGCADVTDFACICSSKPFFGAVRKCVPKKCGLRKSGKTLKWAKKTCKKAGVPI